MYGYVNILFTSCNAKSYGQVFEKIETYISV